MKYIFTQALLGLVCTASAVSFSYGGQSVFSEHHQEGSDRRGLKPNAYTVDEHKPYQTLSYNSSSSLWNHGLSGAWFEHSSADRINTDALMLKKLKELYPKTPIHIVPMYFQYSCNLLSYAFAGNAEAEPVNEENHVLWRGWLPPARRMDGGNGIIVNEAKYSQYLYKYKDKQVLVYIVEGRDGSSSYPEVLNQYVIGADELWLDDLVSSATAWGQALRGEIWVYDGGFWDKSAELYRSVKKMSWDDVILEKDQKKALQDDVNRFFDSRERYQNLRVPWKRGIIYYGPPGNGKTISIKSVMNMLDNRSDPIPSLYVRSLSSWEGPEYSIKAIFSKARQEAPCLLVFEDLDSLVTDDVRSYFLNEVDGLQTNDGVLMIGSTNHLDRLDPGISKRPSRFDRKFNFPKPDFDERVKYCEYWREKLKDNDEIEFPHALSKAIADITDEFSFAYMQEAFVASLLAIAGREDEVSMKKEKDDLDDLILWQELKKQIKILRDEL